LLGLRWEIFKGKFVQNVLTLAAGTGLAQALVLAATPILTRLYSPIDFGALGVYTAAISILSVIVCGRYELAIVVAEEDRSGADLLVLSLGLAVALSGLLLIILSLCSGGAAGLLGLGRTAPWLWLLPPGLLATGWFQAFTYWAVRKKRFRSVSMARLAQAVSMVGGQLAFALIDRPSPTGLVTGFFLGQLTAAVTLGLQTWSVDRREVRDGLTRRGIKSAAAAYKKYPLLNSWPSFLDSLRMSLPVIFLAKFFGSAAAGYFSVAMRVLWLPSSLLGTALSQAFLQRLAEKKSETGKINEPVEKAFRSMSLIGLPYLVVMLLAPLFFEFIFGAGWRTTGLFALIMAPAASLMFVVSPLSVAILVQNRQELSARWQVGAIMAVALVLGLSLPLDSAPASLIGLCLTNLILYVLYAVLIFRVARTDFRRVFIRGWKSFL